MRRTTVRRVGTRLGAVAVALALAAGLAPGSAAADDAEPGPSTSQTTTEPAPPGPTAEPAPGSTDEPTPEPDATEPPPVPTTVEPPPTTVAPTTTDPAEPGSGPGPSRATGAPDAQRGAGSESAAAPGDDFEAFATVEIVANLDVDGDGIGDAGHGVEGIPVLFTSATAAGGTVATGVDGRVWALLPPTVYTAYYQGTSEYAVSGPGGSQSQGFDLSRGQSIKIALNVVVPLYTKLRGQFVFDQPRYGPDGPVSAHVVLSSTTDQPLTGVTATCAALPNGLDASGVGWGALRTGGPGVTVPARGTVTVPITDVVPAGAVDSGFLRAVCFLSRPGYPASSLPSVSAEAAVDSTVLGTARGRLFEQFAEPGVGAPGVGVSLRDPRTGEVRASTTTDAEGRFAFTGVPVGEYDLGLDPAWRLPYISVREITVATRDTGEAFVTVVRTTPGDLQPANLSVLSARLDKAAYVSGEPVRLTVVLRNTGATDATAVTASFTPESNFQVRSGGWDGLASYGQGVRLGAGETRTFTLVGDPSDVRGPIVAFGSVRTPDGDANLDNNRFTVSAELTAAAAEYSGRIRFDADGNGTGDPGEGLAGVEVHAYGGVPAASYTATTDAEGGFVFPALPTGDYSVYYFLGNDPGFVVLGESGTGTDGFTLTPAGRTGLDIRAVRPLSRSLSGAIAFDRASYRVGDRVEFTVTLRNTGATPLTGVHAECDLGESQFSSARGWSPIGATDPGTTLAAGETKVFTTSGTVSAVSRPAGLARVFCELAADGHLQQGRPVVLATARVLGAFGTKSGQLFVDANGDHAHNGEPGETGAFLSGTKVILLDPLSGKPVFATTADGTGRFTFTDVAAGAYEVYVVGPWALVGEPQPFEVREGASTYVPPYEVIAGPERPDLPLEPIPGDQGPPAPGAVVPITGPGIPVAGSSAPASVAAAAAGGLAHTGVDVLGLLGLGLATLVVGAGAIAFATRRRTG